MLRPTTKQSTRSETETPNINITMEDKDDGLESPDEVLPNTPISELSESNRQYLSPTRATTPSARRTPEEKLDKLIELYDGTCSMKEYKDYVKPEEEEGDSNKLEPIAENAVGEEQDLAIDAAVQANNGDDAGLVTKGNEHDGDSKEGVIGNDDDKEEEYSKRSLLSSPTKTVDMVNALEADIELSIDQRSEILSAASYVETPTEHC